MICDTVAFRVSVLSDVAPPVVDPAWVVRPVRPNPFREEASLGIRLAEPSPVAFKVYDVQGGLVRSIEVPLASEGEHHIGWDGRDASGRPVSNGVYLYRVEIPGRCSRSGKVVLFR
jgi:hypothetical protein